MMPDNPFEASPLRIREHPTKVPVTFSWYQLCVAAFITLLVVFVTSIVVIRFTNALDAVAVAAPQIIDIFSKIPRWGGAFGFAFAFILPFVMLTLVVFVSLLRWICLQKK